MSTDRGCETANSIFEDYVRPSLLRCQHIAIFQALLPILFFVVYLICTRLQFVGHARNKQALRRLGG
eukprot:32482-Eustigmatos_ZCMA.PRE.1